MPGLDSPPSRILVLRGGALGDFILTLPALDMLRSAWPEAHIELVGNRNAAELALRSGQLQAAHSQHEARWSTFYSQAPLPEALRTWLAEFDLVINFWPDPDTLLASHFPVRKGQIFLSESAKPACSPAARHFCDALTPLGLSAADFVSRLPRRAFLVETTRKPVPRLALHPGSGSEARNWPLPRWRTLCERIQQQMTMPLIITGEADLRQHAALSDLGEHASSLPLPDLAARLLECTQYIGHDTGVTHLAAALGLRCLALFGPSEPRIWAPPGAHVTVLRPSQRLEDIQVQDLVDWLQR